MAANNLNFASLSTEELDAIKRFEKEFNSKHKNSILLLAYNQVK